MDYGRCVGLRMISWNYPPNESLKELIEETGLFPITVLTLLNRKQKQALLEKEIVLCRQLREKIGLLDQLGLTESKKRKIKEEIDTLLSEESMNPT